MFLVLYITKSSARTGIAARRDEISFFLMVFLCNCGLQFRQQRRPPPKLRSESLDCAQGRGANMMLHSLYVVIDDAVVDAEQPQKISQKFVSLGDFMRQALPARCQNKSAIFFVF